MSRDEIAFERLLLNCVGNDIGARYIAACNLHELTGSKPEMVGLETVDCLEAAVLDPTIVQQRQSLTLCREVAGSLTVIFTRHDRRDLSARALAALKRIIRSATGASHRAVTEALGGLPLTVPSVSVSTEKIDAIPTFAWQELADALPVPVNGDSGFVGRSLVIPTVGQDKLLVIKLGRVGDTPEGLGLESLWLEHLAAADYSFPARFDIPAALRPGGAHVFRLADLPVRVPASIDRHPDGFAIAFLADCEYFQYPNDHGETSRLTREEFQEVMARNSRLLGRLTGQGIVHTAPIPLFHNRIQRGRRTDGGIYDWPLAGRLDRWLSSCRHPNFGVSGLRDFEHFLAFKGDSQGLYWHMGVHLLSLLMVLASYFRNKEPARVGNDSRGRPHDARDLFDRDFLCRLIESVFLNYYAGFVGHDFSAAPPFAVEQLAGRMIDEMGVDRNMEEELRVADQQEMPDELFYQTLRDGGYSDKKARAMQRGSRDIPLITGPHLGGFNQRISLPEIIDATASMAASCVLGRYLHEKNLQIFM